MHTTSTGAPALTGLASLTPARSHRKLMFNGLRLHWFADPKQLSLPILQEKTKEEFGVPACRLTYLDEDGAEAVLWSDLFHFKHVAQSREDAMVVKVYPLTIPAADADTSDAQTAADSPANAAAAAAMAVQVQATAGGDTGARECSGGKGGKQTDGGALLKRCKRWSDDEQERLAGSDPIVVKVYPLAIPAAAGSLDVQTAADTSDVQQRRQPTAGGDTGARGSCGGKGDKQTVSALGKRYMPRWSDDDQERLAGFCTSKRSVDWEHVSTELCRTRSACQQKWREVRENDTQEGTGQSYKHERHWGEGDVEKLHEYRTSGMTWEDIADSLGRTAKACSRRCERRWGQTDHVKDPASRLPADGAGACEPRARGVRAAQSTCEARSRKRPLELCEESQAESRQSGSEARAARLQRLNLAAARERQAEAGSHSKDEQGNVSLKSVAVGEAAAGPLHVSQVEQQQVAALLEGHLDDCVEVKFEEIWIDCDDESDD